VGERKEGWGVWQNRHLLPPSLDSKQRGGRTERAAGRGGAPAVPSTAAAGDGAKWRGGRELPIPALTLGWGCLWRRLHVRRRRWRWGSWWWLDVAVRRGNGGAVMARWCGETGTGLFIAGIRRFGGRYLCSPALRRGRGGLPESRLRGDGTARAGRRDGSGGDGMARAEVMEGGNISPAAARQGGAASGHQGEVTARRAE
jgi:hypothetical protein